MFSFSSVVYKKEEEGVWRLLLSALHDAEEGAKEGGMSEEQASLFASGSSDAIL
jgi:hypothetical protein